LRRRIAFTAIAFVAACSPEIILHRKFLTCIEGGIWPGQRRAEVDYVARLALSLCEGHDAPLVTVVEKFADVGFRDLSVPEQQVRWRVQCGKSDVQIVLSCHAVKEGGSYCRPERGPEITRLPATNSRIEHLAAAVEATASSHCPHMCPNEGDGMSQRNINEECPNLDFRLRFSRWDEFELETCGRTRTVKIGCDARGRACRETR
jgi:hypothetical protein